MPYIQRYGNIKITGTKKKMRVDIQKLVMPILAKKWLLSEEFCKSYLNSRAASIVEAVHAACYNSLNVIKGVGFDPMTRGNKVSF